MTCSIKLTVSVSLDNAFHFGSHGTLLATHHLPPPLIQEGQEIPIKLVVKRKFVNENYREPVGEF